MTNKNQNREEFMNKVIDEAEIKTLSEEEKEFEKYCKLYEEKFGKKAYIAEPSGTREQTINAIRTCLEQNEDLLDNLLYTKTIDNNALLSDRFVYHADDIKFAKTQCEFCKNNDHKNLNVCSQYPNGKPDEIINAKVKCPKLDYNSIL